MSIMSSSYLLNSLEGVTRSLALYNLSRLEPGNTLPQHPDEINYIEILLEHVQPHIPLNVTMGWYCDLLNNGPGQGDTLFDYLTESATLKEMCWFLSQEAAGEAGFDDLVAMTQVKMPLRAKLEMARNYWDEMGRGHREGTHGGLLERTLKTLNIVPKVETTISEALMLSNVMIGLAVHREYTYYSIGALGVIEMTAPRRVEKVDKGLERLGVTKGDREYFTLHATLDIKHSREWNREVIEPLAEEHLPEIATGAYLRLWLGDQCFERYRKELGMCVDPPLQ